MPPRVRLEPVWQHYYGEPLMSGPGWRRTKCPEHEDRTASAQVNTETGKWNCFTCGLAEDAIDIVIRKEGISFSSALQFVEDKLGEGVEEVRGSRRGSGANARGPRSRDAGDGQLALGSRPRRRA